MNELSKLLASISALIAALSLVWMAYTAKEFERSINYYGQAFSGMHGGLRVDLGGTFGIDHDGEVTVNHGGSVTVSHE